MEVTVRDRYRGGVREGERERQQLAHAFLLAESLSKIGCFWQPGDSASVCETEAEGTQICYARRIVPL